MTFVALPAGAHRGSIWFTSVKYRVAFEPASRQGIGGEHGVGGGGGGGGGTIKADHVSLQAYEFIIPSSYKSQPTAITMLMQRTSNPSFSRSGSKARGEHKETPIDVFLCLPVTSVCMLYVLTSRA